MDVPSAHRDRVADPAATRPLILPEAWMVLTESQLAGAVIVGRCAIARHPVGDQEGHGPVRIAAGLLVQLADGTVAGVWWQGPHPGTFAVGKV